MASHGERNATAGRRRPDCFTPRIEALEERLPPGSLWSLADFILSSGPLGQAGISAPLGQGGTFGGTVSAQSLTTTAGDPATPPAAPPAPSAPPPPSRTADTSGPLNFSPLWAGGSTAGLSGAGSGQTYSAYPVTGGQGGSGLPGAPGSGVSTASLLGSQVGSQVSAAAFPGTVKAQAYGVPGGLRPAAFLSNSVNATPGARGEQSEVEVAVDPTNTNRVFALCNNIQTGGDNAAGISESMSSFDGGRTWTVHNFFATQGDPMCAYDAFGNLWMGFMNGGLTETDLLVSGDNGVHFRLVSRIQGIELNPAGANVDYCHMGVGGGGVIAPQSIWYACQVAPPPATPPNSVICAKGGPIFGYVGLNFENIGTAIGPFTGLNVLTPVGPDSDFAGVAVGPEGQVVIAYENQDPSGNDIVINANTSGLAGGGFGPPEIVQHTAMLTFTPIPPLLNRSPDALTRVDFDNSHGPHRGRLYLSYTDRPALGAIDTDIFLRFSDTDGASFSDPIRVNDDPGTSSQFYPNLSVDDSNGDLLLAWYDPREDLGRGGPSDTDRVANTDVRLYGAVSHNGGLSFLPNFRISTGTTSAGSITDPNQLGDYIGIAAYGGVFYAAWSDNSATLPGNVDRPSPDIAVGRGLVNRGNGVATPGDRFENTANNTSNNPSLLGVLPTGDTVLEDLSIYTGDKDWYRFSPAAAGALTITMDIQPGRPAEGDLDMKLYTRVGGRLVQIAASTNQGSAVQESITVNVTAGQDLFLYVYGRVSAFNTGTGLYRLTFTSP